MKFDFGDSYEYMSQMSNFGPNRGNVSGSLCEDLAIIYCCMRH